jgi:hypothetical protein
MTSFPKQMWLRGHFHSLSYLMRASHLVILISGAFAMKVANIHLLALPCLFLSVCM